MPGIFIHDANWQTVGGIGAAEKILNKKLLSAQMLHHAPVEGVKLLRLEGQVDPAPSHGVCRGLILYDEFVFGRTPGAIGVADERSIGRQHGFVAPDGVLHQQPRRKIKMRPAFAQQLGYVADVHRGRHGLSS